MTIDTEMAKAAICHLQFLFLLLRHEVMTFSYDSAHCRAIYVSSLPHPTAHVLVRMFVSAC